MLPRALQVFRMKLYLQWMFHASVGEEGLRQHAGGSTGQLPDARGLLRKSTLEKFIDVVQRLITAVEKCESTREGDWRKEVQALSQLLLPVGLSAGPSFLESSSETLSVSAGERRLSPRYGEVSRSAARSRTSGVDEHSNAPHDASRDALDDDDERQTFHLQARAGVHHFDEGVPLPVAPAAASAAAAVQTSTSISESPEEQTSGFSRRIDQAGWSERRDNVRTPRPGVANWLADKTALADATIDCIDAYNEFFASSVASGAELLLAEMRRLSTLFALTNNSIVVNATRRIHRLQLVRVPRWYAPPTS